MLNPLETSPDTTDIRLRWAGIQISPQFLFDALRLGGLFPDADTPRAFYDFNSDTIRLKWRSKQFGEVADGHPFPYISVRFEQEPDGTVRAASWEYR